MWFKKKPTDDEILATVNDVAKDVIRGIMDEVRRKPFQVEHIVKRNIPRPSAAVVVVENGTGARWTSGIDMTFQNTNHVDIPVAFMTGRDADIAIPPVRIMFNLEYDPRDRRS